MYTLANIAVPWLWQYGKFTMLLLGPAMLAEWLIVRRLAGIGYAHSLGITATMNIVSTLCGYPVVLFLRKSMNSADIAVILLLGLGIACILTILVEWAVLLVFPATAKRAMLISTISNVTSYSIIILPSIWGGYAMI